MKLTKPYGKIVQNSANIPEALIKLSSIISGLNKRLKPYETATKQQYTTHLKSYHFQMKSKFTQTNFW
jgi:hypothetical protein